MLDSELTFYVTEKLDGSSATYVLDRGDFLVCSSNLNLAEDPGKASHKDSCENGHRTRKPLITKDLVRCHHSPQFWPCFQ